MPIWRNFFLGVEPEKRFGLFKSYDIDFAKRTVREEMAKMGIDIRDPDQPVGTMSGGERQSIAISRAVYFGAKVLILDEPTAALGVKQAGIVLHYIVKAKRQGRVRAWASSLSRTIRTMPTLWATTLSSCAAAASWAIIARIRSARAGRQSWAGASRRISARSP